MSRTLTVSLVATPLPTPPLLWPSALRIWVSLAKSMPTPLWPRHPSRRRTKSPHITNKNTNNLKNTKFLFIPRILYVYRTSYLSKLNPKKFRGSRSKFIIMKIKEGLDYSIIKTKVTRITFTWPYSYCQIPTWTLLFYFCFVDSHSWFLCPFFVVFIWDFNLA